MRRIGLVLVCMSLFLGSVAWAEDVKPKDLGPRKVYFWTEFGMSTELHIWTTHNNKMVNDPTFLALTLPVFVASLGTESIRLDASVLFTWGITEFFIEPEIGLGFTYAPFRKYFGIQGGGTIGGLMMNHFSFRAYARVYVDIPIASRKFPIFYQNSNEAQGSETVPMFFVRLFAGYEARTSVKALDYFKDAGHMTMVAHGPVVGLSIKFIGTNTRDE